MKTPHSNPAPDDEDDLAAEYAFDYTKAKGSIPLFKIPRYKIVAIAAAPHV